MKEWKKVFLLTFIALLFRVFHYLVFKNNIVAGGDQIQYILLAKKFASGNFYGVLDVYWTPFYPILVGTLTYFLDSLILPSLIISIATGSLAVTLTYYFVKQSYGENEALIAAVIAIFFPHLMNSVFALGTENIYILLIVGSLFIGWKGLEQNSAKYYMFAGVLIGLSYLTRPEAFGYAAFFVFFALLKDIWNNRKFSPSSFKLIAAFLLAFIILAMPYLIYLKGETGKWTVSGKIGVNLAAGSLQDDEVETEIVPIADSTATLQMLKSFVLSIIYIQKIFAYLLPFLLMIFVALGLFGSRWSKDRFRREMYLIFFCGFTVVGYALAVSQTRYFYILLPIFFGWMARGIIELNRWFKESTTDWMPKKLSNIFEPKVFTALCLMFIYLYVLPINAFTGSTEKLWRTTAYEERDAGIWLKENAKPSPLIFCATRRPVFYAEGEHLFPVTENVEEILAEIKNKKADYVVLSERSLKRNPFLTDFDKKLMNDKDFELIYQKNDQPGYGIVIFKRK